MRTDSYQCGTCRKDRVSSHVIPQSVSQIFSESLGGEITDLDDLELVVAHVETVRSIEAAADRLRP